MINLDATVSFYAQIPFNTDTNSNQNSLYEKVFKKMRRPAFCVLFVKLPVLRYALIAAVRGV